MIHQLSSENAARTTMVNLHAFNHEIDGKQKYFEVRSYTLTPTFTVNDIYERYEGKQIAILAGDKANDGAILLEDGLTLQTHRNRIRLAVLA